VASGEWRVASGEWRVASGEWRVASGQREESFTTEGTESTELTKKMADPFLRQGKRVVSGEKTEERFFRKKREKGKRCFRQKARKEAEVFTSRT